MANQLCTYPPNLAISATLVPLLDPATTSPTTSTTDSDESAMPMKGIQMKSKWKILLADLAKVRKEHDGAKVQLRFPYFLAADRKLILPLHHVYWI